MNKNNLNKKQPLGLLIYIAAYIIIIAKWASKKKALKYAAALVAAGILAILAYKYNVAHDMTTKADAAAPVKAVETTEPDSEPAIDSTIHSPVITGPVPGHVYGLVVNKEAFRATLTDNGRPIKEYMCAIGRNSGQKEKIGDDKTPTGVFPIKAIEDASDWEFGENGEGTFGPWFILLDTDNVSKGRWDGIGVSGTNNPRGLSGASTNGSVRLRNEDITEIIKFLKPGNTVTIKEN